MKRQSWLVFGIGLVLIGGTAGFLSRLQGLQKLGQPGVRVVAQSLYGTNGAVVATNAVDLPLAVLDYTSEPLAITPVELGWLPPDTTYGRRRYKATNGLALNVSVVLMGSDRTSIHQPQYCLTGQGFNIQKSEQTFVPMTRPHRYDLPVMKLTANYQNLARMPDGSDRVLRALYVYWFVADNQLTADHWTRMWWMGRDLVRSGVLQRWAYVSCFAVCWPGQEEAVYSRMQDFLAAAVPQFQLAAGVPLASGSGQEKLTFPVNLSDSTMQSEVSISR